MLDLQPIIRKVQRLRRRKGLNQQRFAEYLGVSLATITRWGRGGWDFTPSLAQLAKMAELFKITVPELLTVDAPAPALPLVPDTAPEAADTSADIVTPDETSQEAEPTPAPEPEAAGVASQIVTNDESLPTSAPEAEPEAQTVNAPLEIVTPDEYLTTPEPADSTPPDEAPSPAAAPISSQMTNQCQKPRPPKSSHLTKSPSPGQPSEYHGPGITSSDSRDGSTNT